MSGHGSRGPASRRVIGRVGSRLVVAALAASALTPLNASGVMAQSGTIVLDPIVVTAGRKSEPVSSIPGSVVVIEREEIEKQITASGNASKLIEKLVPGFSVSNQSISGASENFRGRKLQVLVDGIPRNISLRDNSRILGTIDLNAIERIEVVNGASAIYGNGATGGVINFITKKGEDEKPTTTVSVGTRAFTENVGKSLAPEVSVTTSGKSGAFDYSVTGTGIWTNDSYGGSGRLLPADALLGQGGWNDAERYNGQARVGYSWDTGRLEASGEIVSFDQLPECSTNYATDPISADCSKPYVGRSTMEDSKYARVSLTEESFALGTVTANLYYNDIAKRTPLTEISRTNPDVYYSGDPNNPYSRDGQTSLTAEQWGAQTSVSSPVDWLRDGATLTWGFDYTHERTRQFFQDGVDAIAPMALDNYAGFAQLDIPLNEWLKVRGGVRYDYFDVTVDSFVRPAYATLRPGVPGGVIPEVTMIGGEGSAHGSAFNLGAVATVNDAVEVFGGFSQGFSLPDIGAFTRRVGVGRTGVIDYSDIAPEPQLVDNYEVGFRGNWGKFRADGSIWLSTSDLGTNFDVSLNQVTQEPEAIWGIETKIAYDILASTTIGMIGSYREGWRDIDDDGSFESWLPNNRIGPPLKGTFFVDWKHESGVALHGEVVGFSGRDKNDGKDHVKLESGMTLNLSADMPLAGGKLSLAVDNVLDAEYLNPTASATRNAPVEAFGRTVGVRYQRSF